MRAYPEAHSCSAVLLSFWNSQRLGLNGHFGLLCGRGHGERDGSRADELGLTRTGLEGAEEGF